MARPLDTQHSRCGPEDQRRVVARSSVVTVEACSCGVVHLHFGPLSLRFTRTSLDALQRSLAQACEALAPERPEGPTIWARSMPPRGVA